MITINISLNSTNRSVDLNLLEFGIKTYRRSYYANLTDEEIAANKIIEQENFYDRLNS